MRTQGTYSMLRLRGESVGPEIGIRPEARNERSLIERWLDPRASSIGLSDVDRAELASLRVESDPALRLEGLLDFGKRCERSGRIDLALAVYGEVANFAPPSLAARARRHLDAVNGQGAAGPRAEFLLRHLVMEAADPAMLLGMGTAGAVFRITRLATLGRLVASPGTNFFTRGVGARALASLAGFALEAPCFTFSTRLAGEALGRRHDWSRAALSRELASSYLVLGGLKLAGWGSGAAYRSLSGAEGSLSHQSLAFVFRQSGMLGGIMLGHAAEERLGLRPRVDRATNLVDSLATLLQFNIAGSLSHHAFGEGFSAWERSMDLHAESLSTRRSLSISQMQTQWGPRPAFASMMSVVLEEGGVNTQQEVTIGSGIRPSGTSGAVRGEATGSAAELRPSAEGALRRLLAEAVPLDEEVKRALIARIQAGDSRAADALIRSDIRYVSRMARRYSRAFGLQHADYLDLVQEGCQSLVKTAERFDLNRSNKFLTYASWWIRADVTKYILNHLQDIRIPIHRSEMLRILRREVAVLRSEGEEFGVADIARRLDLTEQQVEELQGQERTGQVLRLEKPTGEEGDGSLLDLIEAPGHAPDHALVGGRLMNLVRRFVESREKPVERAVLEARLLDPEEPTQKELAERLGLTRGQVKNLEKALLQRLRHFLSAAGLHDDGRVLVDVASQVLADPEPLASKGRRSAPSLELEAARAEASAAPFTPRIAVIGFGMAGVGATNALRNSHLFSEGTRDFRPEITVFEGMSRTGGKVAPDNLGAQFIDARNFYPIDRLVANLGLQSGPLRGDYDSAPFITRSGEWMSGHRFSQSLRLLRQAAREALRTRSWDELDKMSAADFIRDLGRREGPLEGAEVEAMVSRLGFEEGTLNVSMLSFAVNLAKSETPMERYEISGGLHRIPEAERGAIEAAGGRVLLGHPVHGVDLMQDGLRVLFSHEGVAREERFDYGILALAPEHLRRVEVSGSSMPIASVASLEPAHIVKTNIRSNLVLPEQERATARFALWFSPDHKRPERGPMATFFHGWNGEPMLRPGEMVSEAYGLRDPEAYVGFESQIWDGRPQDGIPHFYTTMPSPGRGMEMVRFAMDQYFEGRYDAERLKLASHVLGLGCYIRDAALSGEWSAISLMRGMGMDVRHAYARNPRPEREFIGAERIR